MKRLVPAGADAHPKPAETRMDAASHGGGGRVRARRGPRLTDADYAAMVKRYEDAGDVQNADIIRRQWEAARGGARNRKRRDAADDAS
jgi:hypothetical protein